MYQGKNIACDIKINVQVLAQIMPLLLQNHKHVIMEHNNFTLKHNM